VRGHAHPDHVDFYAHTSMERDNDDREWSQQGGHRICRDAGNLHLHTEFMTLNYAHAQVQMSPDKIDVTLTRHGSVPAEMRLARSEEGCALLRQVHEAMFVSCEDILRGRIEPVVERKVRKLVTTLDSLLGAKPDCEQILNVSGMSSGGSLLLPPRGHPFTGLSTNPCD